MRLSRKSIFFVILLVCLVFIIILKQLSASTPSIKDSQGHILPGSIALFIRYGIKEDNKQD